MASKGLEEQFLGFYQSLNVHGLRERRTQARDGVEGAAGGTLDHISTESLLAVAAVNYAHVIGVESD